MASKGNRNHKYTVHGDGIDTLRQGLIALDMPTSRQAEALAIVRDVFEANSVTDFRWYKPAITNELACYWDDAEQNLLWVTVSEVHVFADETLVKHPQRPVNWQKEEGVYVGWMLPGALAGTGGGARKTEAPYSLCPTGIRRAVGELCPDCEIVHPTKSA